MSKTAAVVEDEKDVAELVRHTLQKEGYRVRTYGDGALALAAIEAEPPDFVILDLMLPRMDGFEVCRKLRANPRTAQMPILMLTARAEAIDEVAGLEVGADDYIAKPFSPRVLLARVRSVLRRGDRAETPAEVIHIGPIQIDSGRHEVKVGEKKVNLTITEFRILKFLASRPGRVRTRLEIVEEVSGDVDVLERTVDAHVTALRRKLGEAGERVETVRGVGYRVREES
jgi:two-component system phosphate regulon response regulator PhoB